VGSRGCRRQHGAVVWLVGRCRFVVRGHPCPHRWGSRPWERRRPRRHGAVVWLAGQRRSVVRGHPCRHGWGGGESGRGRGFYGRGPPPPTRASHCDGIWECFRAHPTSFIPRDDDGPARAPALPGWCAAFPRQSTDWRASADLWSAGIPARMGGAARAPALPGWYAAFPRQSTVWWAGADLWSAGVPPRMGGVVRICDMDGAFVGENPHPLRVAPIATGEGSDAVPTRRSSFHVMTMGRRGRRRSQDDAPPIPINPLIGGQVPICGPRASLPAWAG